MSLIAVEDISLCFGARRVLDGVSLDVNAGDFITIVGPNGAGKSQLLKCMMGLVTPHHGRVTQQSGLKIGYVPQDFVIDPSLPLRVSRFLTLQLPAHRLAEVAAFMSIEPLLQSAVQTLSGGERQRVLMARALMMTPDVLILDEPAQNMDVAGQLAFYHLIDAVREHFVKTVVMVSHDLHFVMASSTRVVCLYHHVCCSGQPEEVQADPAFRAIFGADMAKMMAVYTHTHDHVHDQQCVHHDHSGA